MLYYTTRLIPRMDPIKYIFEKPALTRKISRLANVALRVRHCICDRKSHQGPGHSWLPSGPTAKWSRTLDSLFPNKDVTALELEPNSVEPWRWKLYFDGVANSTRNGVGAVLVSPKGQQIPVSVKLNFDCTNNNTECKVCIVGLQVALEFGTYDLSVFGDSLLIISQI